MILSRSKPATDSRTSTGSSSAKRHVPELEDFILKRDYTGALTMLEFLKNEGNTEVWADAWAAWSWFHLGEYRRALDAYMRVRGRANLDARVADTLDMDLAVCYFYLALQLYHGSQQ
ncbi:intraflagellar transport protein 56-like [Choristoneura fumiferana]|uniref:intraflagellar transport protein 56-like n=1 Tax=Choristoneura fumiferana TaxID=7141 RepID=UPI003D15BBE6